MRDNSHGCDTDLRCTRLTTTEVVSIYEWADPADADEFVAKALSPGDTVKAGPVTTLTFHSGGSTPPYDRAAYDAVLAQVP